MSASPYGEMSPGQPAWPPPAFPPPRQPSRAPLILAIAVAVIALAVAIASWFRPAPEPKPVAAPTYSDSEVADAKKQVCDAFNLAHDAIVVAGNKQDPANPMAFAANARLAFFAGAQFLQDAVVASPAAPSDVVDAAEDYSVTYTHLSLILLADKTPEQLDKSLVDSGDAANNKLKQLCQ